MSRAGVPKSARTDEVKRAARRIGLDCLQQYLDHLTGTRVYSWFEARKLTEDNRRQLTELLGQEDLDRYEQSAIELVCRKSEPLRGAIVEEHLSAKDLTALVDANPFVRWYREERLRLQRDARLLAIHAKQQESIAQAALVRA
jgi:hypothetical protein